RIPALSSQHRASRPLLTRDVAFTSMLPDHSGRVEFISELRHLCSKMLAIAERFEAGVMRTGHADLMVRFGAPVNARSALEEHALGIAVQGLLGYCRARVTV